MTKLLFVCLGNICRSPMAEYVMKDLVQRAGLEDEFFIDSAATSDEEVGNPVHHGTRQKLREVGVPCGGHRARQMTRADYGQFDYLIGMETRNLRNMERILGGDPDGKVRLLLGFAGKSKDIADPWYTGNFDVTYDDVLEGCKALLEHCKTEL